MHYLKINLSMDIVRFLLSAILQGSQVTGCKTRKVDLGHDFDFYSLGHS